MFGEDYIKESIKNAFDYVKEIVVGLWGLLQGLYITMLNMLRPKITEQYPENRGKVERMEAFRALLTMPHDADNFHKCTACGICQMNCPNNTIQVISKMEVDPATGKERKVLDRYIYDLGSCIFCALCTQTCPSDAIEWSNNFEHSLFTRGKLYKQLNRPGSSLKPKPAPATAAAPTAPAAVGGGERASRPGLTASAAQALAVPPPASASAEAPAPAPNPTQKPEP